MPTSGGYVAPVIPECSYQARMTRAAALALRAANGLLENCVVVITDGPTIGITGNTSPTEIELQPVSSNEFGMAAIVNTTFDNNGWQAIYDIDLGVAGSIISLTDNFNNTVSDPDADSPTVHTQWPWHLASATFRDNRVNDAVLPGWPGAGALTVRDCVINGTTIDLTGSTGANTWDQTEFMSAMVLNGGANTFSRCRFAGGATNHSGSGAMTLTNVRTYNFFRITHTGTATTLTMNNVECSGFGSGTTDILHAATVGNTIITDSEIYAGNPTPAQPTIHNESSVGGGNQLSIIESKILSFGYYIHKAAGATQAIAIQDTIVRGTGVIECTATSTGQLTIIGADIQSGSVISNGAAIRLASHPVTLVAAGCQLVGATVQTLVGSTKTLSVLGSFVNGGIIQSSVVAIAESVIENSRINGQAGAVVVDITGAGANTTTIMRSSEISNGARLNTASVGDAGAIVLENTQVTNGAILTMTAGASSIKNSRISTSANVTSGVFAHNQLIIDLPITRTLTAANVNRLENKSFSDVI